MRLAGTKETMMDQRQMRGRMLGTLWVVAFAATMLSVQAAPVGARDALRGRATGGAYTPPAGSTERKALMDAMRGYTLKLLGGTIPGSRGTIIFTASHLKVHGGWAFATVAPKATDGKWEGEPLSLLLHRPQGRWAVADVVSYDDAIDGKVSDAEIMRRFRAKHRQATGDIF